MIRFFFLLLTLAAPVISTAQAGKQPVYHYTVNLTGVKDDKLTVELDVPALHQKELVFRLPKMVPGIYGELNYGQNIGDITATDTRGKTLAVTQVDINTWKISNAAKLKTLRYTVNDDWDNFGAYQAQAYRSPGSMFEQNKVFMINNNTLFGYFEGYDHLPLTLSYQKPAGLYAATSLPKTKETAGEVNFSATSYHHLVDNPVLFTQPDTAQIYIGDVNVTVACYSTSGTAIAKTIAKQITPLLKNQKAYLGGELPVKKYTFIIYHHAGTDSLSSFGDGLEHAQSTVILLNMYLNPHNISMGVYGIASHEFFHTVMPLALHSREIEFYNFAGPTMSQHLWLYEGMTEYFTMHMPVLQQVQTLEGFCNAISDKIYSMDKFDYNLSLTDLSKQAVSRQDQYMNVYQRGPLVCLCLDIRLRELSGGKYGVQDMVNDLLKRYGKNKPFNDNELFDEMVSVTGKTELKDFFSRYIAGSEPPPLEEYLAKAGLLLTANRTIQPMANATGAQLALRKAWINQ